jgi:hypothetical protein
VAAGLLILAVPAAVWIGAGVDQVVGDCGLDCGDRDRGWFMLVVVTAPLIPLGGLLIARRPGPPLLAVFGRVACLLTAGAFAVIGLGLVAVGIGAFVDLIEGNYAVNLDDPEGSLREAMIGVVMWKLAALWCFAVSFGLVVVRRRLGRRYPSRTWHPGDRSTSAG